MTDQPASWGAWMVPSLSPAEDMRLRVVELDLQRSVKDAPEVVAALAGQLARQNAQLQAIVRAAAGRVLELEARLAAAEKPQGDPLGPFVEMARSLQDGAEATRHQAPNQPPHSRNPLVSLMGRVVITHATRQAWATVKACCSKGFQLFGHRFGT